MQSRPMQVSVSVTNLNRVNQPPLTPSPVILHRNFSVMSVPSLFRKSTRIFPMIAYLNILEFLTFQPASMVQVDDVRLRCEFMSGFRITEQQAFSFTLSSVCSLRGFISRNKYKSRNFYLLARIAPEILAELAGACRVPYRGLIIQTMRGCSFDML